MWWTQSLFRITGFTGPCRMLTMPLDAQLQLAMTQMQEEEESGPAAKGFAGEV